MRMRLLLAATASIFSLIVGAPASAETRTFIIANNADGYGIDRCLASGAACGTQVAGAYCRTQQFAAARSFRKIERDEITGAVPTSTGGACKGNCDEFIAIECAR